MEILYIALVVIYIFVCFFLVLVVLLQQGKGADIAGAFGGGGSQTAFGARGATTLLHKLTTGAFVGFILLALVLTLLEARPRSSVVRTLPAGAQKAPPAPAPQPAGATSAPSGQPAGQPAGTTSAPAPAGQPPAPAPQAPANPPAAPPGS